MLNIGKIKPTINVISVSVSNDMDIHKDKPLHPTNIMLTTSQNKPVYTGIFGVHNRKYVNKGEPVQMKNIPSK